MHSINNQRGLSLVETMVGLVISSIVVVVVVDVIAEISVVNARHQVESLVNQSYYQGVQTALNAALYTDRNALNPDPLQMSVDLRACLSNKPRNLGGGLYFNCRSLDSGTGAGTPVPAALSAALNGGVGNNGPCSPGEPSCLIERKTSFKWVCPSSQFCSGLRLEVTAAPVASAVKDQSSSARRAMLSWKERKGSVFIPARQLMSKGEVNFQCATAQGNFSLFRIDYVNLTDRGGCATFDPGAPCSSPMITYGNNNCLAAQSAGCGNGFTQSGLYANQNTCMTNAAPPPQTCSGGGVMGSDGVCQYANRWCHMSGPTGPNIGFQDPGAVSAAGCFWGYDGQMYQPNQVATASPGGTQIWARCMSGPASPYPLPDSNCPAAAGGANPIAGSCGPAAGAAAGAPPTTGLCATGTPSAVGGTGPYSWTCAGQNGGASANCASTTGGGYWADTGQRNIQSVPALLFPNVPLCPFLTNIINAAPDTPLPGASLDGPACPTLASTCQRCSKIWTGGVCWQMALLRCDPMPPGGFAPFN